MLELTSNDCGEILSKSLNLPPKKFKIIRSRIEKCQGFKGFLGEYFQLKIDFSRKNQVEQKDFFVKSISITNQKQKEYLEESGIFRKETELYSKLIPKLNKYFGKDDQKWCPDCFLVRKNILIFENLQKKNFYNLPNQLDFQQNHIMEIMKSLAKFHASSVRYQEKEIKKYKTIGEEFKEVLFETSFDPNVSWCITGFKAIVAIAMEKTKYSRDIKMRDLMDRTLLTRLYEIFEMFENPDPEFVGLRVLSHRDLWRNNIMFQFDKDLNGNVDFNDPKHCVLLDFQTARFLPLCLDVMHAIVGTTRRAHHQNMIKRYLEQYYQFLKNELALEKINLESKYPWESFLESCRYFSLVPLVINCICVHLTLLPPDFMQHLNEVDTEGFYKFCNVDRNEIILDRIDKDDYFRDCVLEAVEELIEYLYLDCKLIK